jgi:hypothetical protein
MLIFLLFHIRNNSSSFSNCNLKAFRSSSFDDVATLTVLKLEYRIVTLEFVKDISSCSAFGEPQRKRQMFPLNSSIEQFVSNPSNQLVNSKSSSPAFNALCSIVANSSASHPSNCKMCFFIHFGAPSVPKLIDPIQHLL